jgi:hypothetical protein
MADTLLEKIFKQAPIDWSGGFDLCVMNERRKLYITSLHEADRGNFKPLLKFVNFPGT